MCDEIVVESMSGNHEEAHANVSNILPQQRIVRGQLKDRIVEFRMGAR